MKKRIVVGLSGGVDSSVAAYLLKEQGHEVIGMFMRNWHDTTGTLAGDCPWNDDRMFAELVAKRLDIPFHFIDLSEGYRHRVVDYMFSEYAKGRTPNPDVLCNREVKFDLFLKAALELGADYVATGHYCRREDIEVNGEIVHRLLAGVDPNKDQSYFLCQLTQYQLSKSLFPIGELIKPEVRRIATEQNLATAERKDSQGICFVGKVDLPVFLQQQLTAKRGNIVEIPASWRGYDESDGYGLKPEVNGAQQLQGDGKATLQKNLNSAESSCMPDMNDIKSLQKLAEPYRYSESDGVKVGEHQGAHFFTIGQRKGINVGGKPEPLFVIAIDVQSNTLYVGQSDSHPGLYRSALHIIPSELHWIRPDRELKIGQSRRFSMRIRYRQPLQQGTLMMTSEGGFIVFDKPQRGITAGQFASWYDSEELVGSGVINA